MRIRLKEELKTGRAIKDEHWKLMEGWGLGLDANGYNETHN